jgi:type IV secretion system protein VirD4
MTPDEITRIKPPRKARDGVSEKIVEPGLMLIFVAGHFPILGTQMLYFADPVLAKRAELAPPTKFFALEEGKLVPQSATDRTAHTISKPELAAPDESDLSPTERGYLEETRRNKEA